MNSPVTLSTFLDKFPIFTANKLLKDTVICIISDFNIHINNGQDNEANIISDIMEAMGLQQYVEFTTHKLGNILDLVFTEVTGKLKVTKGTPGPFLSDHWTVECQLSVRKNESKSKDVSYISYRKLDKININNMVNDIDFISLLSEQDLNIFITCLEQSLRDSLDKHSCILKKKSRGRNRQPWFTTEIKTQKQRTRTRERIWHINNGRTSVDCILRTAEGVQNYVEIY